MNKKLFFGIISIAFIAGIFVACGEGAIEAYNTDDNVADLTFGNSLDIKKSETACQANPECLEKLNQVQPTSSAEPPPPSSSEEPVLISSSSVMFPTSSSSLITITSSTTIILPPSSSTIVIVSSSSVITPEGGLAGTCAPDPAIAELDTSVTWSFKRDPSVTPQQVIAATFDWAFEGGSIESFSGQGASGISKSLTYAKSGKHTTTLSINGTTPIACTPVQVNGAPITECECTVDNPSPDVAAGGVATWSVTGCLTTANISGYAWAGSPAVPTTTFAHTFTAKGEVFTPTLSVYNDDNTVQPVTCPAATAIDATKRDYVLDGTAADTLEAGTYSMQYACPTANQHYQPPINISAFGVWENFNVTYSTKTTPAGSSLNSEQHNIAFASLFGSWSGALPTEMVSITVNHAVVIKCQ